MGKFRERGWEAGALPRQDEVSLARSLSSGGTPPQPLGSIIHDGQEGGWIGNLPEAACSSHRVWLTGRDCPGFGVIPPDDPTVIHEVIRVSETFTAE